MTVVSKHAVVAAALAGLSLLVVKDAVLGGGAFFERDLLSVLTPGVEGFVQATKDGALPLRDMSSAFGQPMLGNPDAQIPYPTTWLHLLMLPERAYPLIFLLHYFLGATGAAALCWRFSRSAFGAFLAGASWLVCGPFQSFMTMIHHFAGASWMPWVLTGFERVLEQPDRRRILVLSALFGMQILAGSADMCAMTLLLSALRLLCEAPSATGARLWRQFSAALAACGVAACLGAATWLTVADIARSSLRSSMPADVRTYWSTHPALLAEFIMPLGLGTLNLVPSVNDLLYEGREPLVRSTFMGSLILPLFLAAMASRDVPLRLRVFGGVGALVSGLVTLGKHAGVYGLIVGILPFLKIFRYPTKAIIPTSLLLCVFAGVALQCLNGDRPRKVARSAALLLAALHVLVVIRLPDFVVSFIDSRDASVQRDAAWHIGGDLMFSAAILLAFAFALMFRWTAISAFLATAAVFFSLVLHANVNPVVPRPVLRFRPDESLAAVGLSGPSRIYVSDYLNSPGRSQRFLGRASPFLGMKTDLPDRVAEVVAYRSMLIPPVGGPWGIEYAWDTDMRGLFQTALRDLTLRVGALEGTPAFLRMLQVANVSRVLALHTSTFGQLQLRRTVPSLTPEPLYIFNVPDPLPRAYAVSGVRVLETPAASVELLNPQFHPSDEVIVDHGTPSLPSRSFAATVEITLRRADRVELAASMNEPGHVVLLEGFLPGWTVAVDGKAATLNRANAFFLAVPVPQGPHQIVFTYRPWTAVIGLSLSALTAVFLLLVLARDLTGGVARKRADGEGDLAATR